MALGAVGRSVRESELSARRGSANQLDVTNHRRERKDHPQVARTIPRVRRRFVQGLAGTSDVDRGFLALRVHFPLAPTHSKSSVISQRIT